MRVPLGIGLGLALLLALGATASHSGEWTATTGGHLDWYQDDASPSTTGRLLFVPLSLGYQGEQWGMRASGGYAASAFRPGEDSDASLDHTIDTTASAAWWPGVLGGQAVLGMDLDLPSGQARLTEREQRALQDRDLVLISTFGAGWNVNVHADWARAFGRITAGVGAGYLLKRKFDPTADIIDDDLDPGSQWTASARVSGLVGEFLQVGLDLTHMRFGVDERGGQRAFQVGPVWIVGVSATYQPEPWWTRVSARWVTTGKHRRITEAGEFSIETHRGSGDAVLVGVEIGYIVTQVLAFRGMGDVYYYTENGYAPDHPFFDAGRTKAALGPGVTWSPRRNITLDASVKGFVLWDERDAIRRRDTRFIGAHVDLVLSVRF